VKIIARAKSLIYMRVAGAQRFSRQAALRSAFVIGEVAMAFLLLSVPDYFLPAAAAATGEAGFTPDGVLAELYYSVKHIRTIESGRNICNRSHYNLRHSQE